MSEIKSEVSPTEKWTDIDPLSYGYNKLGDNGNYRNVLELKGWEASLEGNIPRFKINRNGIATTIVAGPEALSVEQVSEKSVITVLDHKKTEDGLTVNCKLKSNPSDEATTLWFNPNGEFDLNRSTIGRGSEDVIKTAWNKSLEDLKKVKVNPEGVVQNIISDPGKLLSFS